MQTTEYHFELLQWNFIKMNYLLNSTTTVASKPRHIIFSLRFLGCLWIEPSVGWWFSFPSNNVTSIHSYHITQFISVFPPLSSDVFSKCSFNCFKQSVWHRVKSKAKIHTGIKLQLTSHFHIIVFVTKVSQVKNIIHWRSCWKDFHMQGLCCSPPYAACAYI